MKNYIGEIIRPHVKPHIDYQALANRYVFMQDKPGISSQCRSWCPSVVSKESRYQYHWEFMVGYIKSYQLYESMTEKCAMNGRTSDWCNEWQNIRLAPIRRLLVSVPRRLWVGHGDQYWKLDGFLKLSLFLCEIDIVLGAFYTWVDPRLKSILRGHFSQYFYTIFRTMATNDNIK